MKINTKKRSAALVFVALISLLALVSAASATTLSPVLPTKVPVPTLASPSVSFTWCCPYPASVSENIIGGYPIQFTDTSKSGYPITKWSWKFSYGYPTSEIIPITSNLQNPKITFIETGEISYQMTVTLTVTDSIGRTSSYSRNFIIY